MPNDDDRMKPQDDRTKAKPSQKPGAGRLQGDADAARDANQRAAEGDRVEKTPNPGHPV